MSVVELQRGGMVVVGWYGRDGRGMEGVRSAEGQKEKGRRQGSGERREEGGIGRGCYQTQFGHPGRQGRGCDNLRWKETPFGN